MNCNEITDVAVKDEYKKDKESCLLSHHSIQLHEKGMVMLGFDTFRELLLNPALCM